MAKDKDYYIVLGVNRGANLSKIKRAYRTVIKRYHPDITHTKESTAKFLEVKEAYETLSDEQKRIRYDEELAGKESELKISKQSKNLARTRNLFDEIEGMFSSFTDDFFEGFMPGFFDSARARIIEKDLYFEAILSPKEAADGGLFPITVPVIEPCPRCSKTGLWEDFLCPVCSGYGRVKSKREFSLSIPPRVKDGTKIRLSMEDIGLRNVYINILVTVKLSIEEEPW